MRTTMPTKHLPNVETNGTNALPTSTDWVTLSPKNIYDGGNTKPVVLDKCNELKVVYIGQPLEDYFNIDASFITYNLVEQTTMMLIK